MTELQLKAFILDAITENKLESPEFQSLIDSMAQIVDLFSEKEEEKVELKPLLDKVSTTIDNYADKNAQDFLNWLDALNQLSIKY